MRSVLLCVCLAAGLPLAAQIGRSPGGGIPMPWPRRGGTRNPNPSGKDTAAQALTKYGGTLRRIDEHSFVVEADDARVLEFQRLDKMKVFKDSAEIQAAELKVGDRLSVEARQDREGYLYAVNVYLEKAAAKTENTGASEPSAPSAKPDAAPLPLPEDDPDRPRLHRGAPSPRRPAGTEDETPAVPAADLPRDLPHSDPLIEKARDAASAFSGKLPDYVCREFMARYESMTRPVDWKALDVVSADVVYEGQKESYRNLEVNGRATKKSIEQIGGSWSTGEFGSMLLDLFSPATAARFEPARESSAAGRPTRVYRFQVEQPHSHWHVQAPAQSINPAYKGSVWIDTANGRVLRIEMQARQIPEGFPLDTVESAVDYAAVRIGSGEFLLPVHAESLSCERGTSNCSRSAIDFRNYHKYNADSSVTFDAGEK